MCDQRKNEIVVLDMKLAIRSLLILMLAACFAVGSAQLQPSQCTMVRPRSTQVCSKEEQEKRYFFKESVGRCERFGICPEDAASLDQSTVNTNYFLTMRDCEEGCFVCPHLEAIANGNVTVGLNRTAGNTASYTCNLGYALVGSSTRTCLSSGNWSETEPHCRVKCPAPPEVLNALIFPHKRLHNEGSTVHYYCSGLNMKLVGNFRRTCLSNGNWSGSEPYCEVQCPLPELIEHGYPTAPERSVGSSSTYICEEGYTLFGTATRVCTEERTWNGSLPFCGRVEITYDSEDVTNSELLLNETQPDVYIKCHMSPCISPENMSVPEWRVTNGDNLPFPYEKDEVLQQPILTFGHLFIDHANNYTCKIGELEATVLLTVIPPPPTPSPTPSPPKRPVLQIPPRDTTLSQGEDINLFCIFTGCPLPNITWFHYNESVHTDGRRQVMKQSIHNEKATLDGLTFCLLTIQRLSMEDVGEYRCVAKNILGNASSSPAIVEIRNTSVKRSADEQSSSYSHCNADSSTVTVIGKVRRSRPRRSGEILHSYRMKVSRVLRNSASYSQERKPLTVLLAHNPDTIKLKRDATYVLTGHIVDDNVMYVSSDNLIHPHSPELEDSIRSC